MGIAVDTQGLFLGLDYSAGCPRDQSTGMEIALLSFSVVSHLTTEYPGSPALTNNLRATRGGVVKGSACSGLPLGQLQQSRLRWNKAGRSKEQRNTNVDV